MPLRYNEKGALTDAVVWDTLVIYWLAFGRSAAQAEKDLLRSSLNDSRITLISSMKKSPEKADEKGKLKAATVHVTFEAPAMAHLEGTQSSRKDSAATLIAPAPQRLPDGGV